MGGDQDAGAAGPGVRDHVHGGLDADRVDAVEGLVEQQHLGLVQGGEHHREPAAHAVREAGGDPVRDVAELEPLQQVAGPVLPASGSRRSRAESCRCSQGVARGHQPAHVGAVAGGLLDRQRLARTSCPATVTVPAVGGTTPASTRIVVDFPAPLRPSSAVACPAYATRSMPRHRLHLAEAHVQVADLDDRRGLAHPPILPARTGRSREVRRNLPQPVVEVRRRAQRLSLETRSPGPPWNPQRCSRVVLQ